MMQAGLWRGHKQKIEEIHVAFRPAATALGIHSFTIQT